MKRYIANAVNKAVTEGRVWKCSEESVCNCMQLWVHLLVVRRVGFCAKGRAEGGNVTVQILAGVR